MVAESSLRCVIHERAIPKARMTHRSKWSTTARKTLDFQRRVADQVALCAMARYKGPVCLTVRFYFASRKHGDLKNLIGAVEDALQYGEVILNDKQIIRYGAGTGIYLGDPERIEIELCPTDY